MKFGKYTLKDITFGTSEESISMKTTYERDVFDDEGHPMCKKDEFTAEYNFREVERDELMQLRLQGKPGLVYKKAGKLYYVRIPANLKLTKMKEHACGNCSRICKDCARTRDLTVAFQERDGKKFPHSVFRSWRIEKYDFVVEGVEAFNMKANEDAFMVYDCQNYVPYGKRVKSSGGPSRAELLGRLAALRNEGLDGTYRAARELIERNLRKAAS